MSGRLEGRIAIVTGASRGIGAAIATAFAREGAKVVIASRKQKGVDAVAETINAEVPGSTHARACHVGKPSEIADLVGWTQENVGLTDILVNNVGTNPYFGPLLDVPPELWDKTFDINLKGYFEPTRLVAKALLEAKKPGSIVNIASIAGMRGLPLQGVYGMTKAAIISMTQSLALELGSRGIRVNAVAPGLIETRLASAITASPELSSPFTSRTALGRHGQPEELAGMAVFLASDESSFVTGQTLCADGGWSAS